MSVMRSPKNERPVLPVPKSLLTSMMMRMVPWSWPLLSNTLASIIWPFDGQAKDPLPAHLVNCNPIFYVLSWFQTWKH